MPGLTFKDIFDTVSTNMTAPETSLRNTLAKLGSGGSMGITDMYELQFQMGNYTMTAQIGSTCLKEEADTCKGIIQKI